MAPSSDEAVKARIISHMNKDHLDSLSRYLEVFSGLSYFQARSSKMEDLTLSSLKIRSVKGDLYTIPISPPMSSMSESRTRLVAMHEECGRRLGRDPITVTRFRWPKFVDGLIIFGVVLGLVVLTDGSNFAPGSFLASTLFKPVPHVASIAERWHWHFWWLIIALHIGEAALMVSWMKKYNVQPLSKIWMLYVGFTAIEGFGCGKRLRAEVRKEKSIKEQKSAKEGSH